MRTKTKHKVVLPIAVLLAATCSVSIAQTYDPASGFSDSVNPSGVWSYGYSLTFGSPLILHTSSDMAYGFPVWRTDIAFGDPLVGYNPTATEITFSSITIGPHELLLHPGINDEFAMLRFTAPSAGPYHVVGSFFGRDTAGTTTDVHVLANGTSIFDGAVNGYGPGSGSGFDSTVSLAAGGHIDFAVGFGSNGNLFNDSTGFVGAITPVPEPAGSYKSWALLHGLNGTDAGKAGDPDRDGLPNWDEYCFGTSPTEETPSLMKAQFTGTTLTLGWLEITGVRYDLKESSTLLAPWSASAAIPTVSTDQAGVPAGYKRMRATIPVPAPSSPAANKFFRVEAVAAP